MFISHSSKLTWGVLRALLVLVAAASAASAAIPVHSVVIAKVSLPHDIDPIDPTCMSASPCIEYQNNGSGYGIEGIGKQKAGIFGETLFNSVSSSDFANGIVGQDASTRGTFDSGVEGRSTRGRGVLGVSSSGPGVTGQSATSIGVSGYSPGGTGVLGTSTDFTGVGANSTNGIAVDANSTNSAAVVAQAFGQQPSVFVTAGDQGDGVDVYVNNPTQYDSFGVYAVNPIGTAIWAQGGSCKYYCHPVLLVDSSGNQIIQATENGSQRLSLDNNGNLSISGQIYTSGTCSTGCSSVKMQGGGEATAYSARVSEPTIEDFGQGDLINGIAQVTLDPKFARTIDDRSPYFVFLTPDGDNAGLYVASKSHGGFVVRESHGGHSTILFDYRVVARPYDVSHVRLPAWTIRDVGPPVDVHHHQTTLGSHNGSRQR